MKEYWKNNINRRNQQSKFFSDILTQYVYNIYKENILIKEHIYYKELVDIGLKYIIGYFAKEDKILNKNNKNYIEKLQKLFIVKDIK